MNETAKSELWRQSIILVFTLVTVGVLYVVNDPDAWREVKMRTALKIKHGAQKVADKAQEVAGKAATVYQQEQP